MATGFKLPLGLRCWPHIADHVSLNEGFDLALLEDCNNAYRFTALTKVAEVRPLLMDFSRFLSAEAFFILEYYPEDTLPSRTGESNQHPDPTVYYSPYLETDFILRTIEPYLERLIHDGFVGFGLANNRMGMECFYSEEKVLTFFTDNHLRMCNLFHRHRIPHSDQLTLPSDFAHDHLSLLGFSRRQLPSALANLSRSELDTTIFCRELVELLDMYQVEEGLSFFLTRKEQEQIAALVKAQLPGHDFSDVEFGGLLLDWSDFVTECENEFDGDLWEYKQGLRIRDMIQLVIEIAEPELAEKIESIVSEPDHTFHTILTDRRLRLDVPNEITLERERFWYQGMIRNQGTVLRRDLIRCGWFDRRS